MTRPRVVASVRRDAYAVSVPFELVPGTMQAAIAEMIAEGFRFTTRVNPEPTCGMLRVRMVLRKPGCSVVLFFRVPASGAALAAGCGQG